MPAIQLLIFPTVFNVKLYGTGVFQRFSDGVPDGAIVHARRIMLRPHSNDHSTALINALRKAVAAGLPYFGVGLQLLRDMLQVASVEHDDAKALLEQIAPAAARLDPRQLFTVLRFPRMTV